ncbi:MAG TPA: sugar phosphate isomerase/epimerase [Oscillospiraceae bacterium]|nr:sugar phosphate isomerase/epimerase [Oscillospiraceae bacterium]HPF55286.1 sugar phosphate isomerase/epimerase [Clostridiales bacterium]HPK34690.1 sugar phosphate isomerase/epimerase [Oscillospiraceae bacterium]HPR74546.1 sugar phosphate isomerase/epimerase [Oscillospiraceae bacterium]
MGFGIQLYSLRDVIKDDVAGTLKKVGEMGYTEVEFAGYYGLKPAEMAKLLDDSGLKAVSTHVGPDGVGKDFDMQMEYNLAVGSTNIVLASGGMETADDVKKIAELLSNAAEKGAKSGVKVGYHNHAYEFERMAGSKRFIDLLAEESDPRVTFEFDVYWVKFAGVDPMEYVKKYAGREVLMHMKELGIVNGEKKNVELGDGIIDFKSLITTGKQIGIKHFIVEQEGYTMPVLDSCARSAQGVLKLGLF